MKNLFFLLRALMRHYMVLGESASAPQRFKDDVAEAERLQAESRKSAKQRKMAAKAAGETQEGEASASEDDEPDDDTPSNVGTNGMEDTEAVMATADSDDDDGDEDGSGERDKPKSGLLWILKQLAFVARRGE